METDPDFRIEHVVKMGQLKPESLVTSHMSTDFNRRRKPHQSQHPVSASSSYAHDLKESPSQIQNTNCLFNTMGFVKSCYPPQIGVGNVSTSKVRGSSVDVDTLVSMEVNAKGKSSSASDNASSALSSSIGSTEYQEAIENMEEEDWEVESNWKRRSLQNPHLFNATKFRFHSISVSQDSEKVLLCLGVTDYKEYLGTNWSPNVINLQEQGLQLYSDPQAFLSDALGVGASVVTTDNCLILLRRGEHLAEAAGLWDIPGGHAEPQELVGNIPLAAIDLSTLDSQAVTHEVFDSILREVRDEVNIPLEKLSPPLYMGTHRNTTSAGRPSLAFVINCSLSNDEVRELYTKGSQQEADETTNICFVPVDEVPSLHSKKNGLWKSLAPSAKGNLTCFSLSHGLIA